MGSIIRMFPHDLDLTELLDGDLDAVDDDAITATMVGLEDLETRLQAARLRVQSEWDRRQLWALDGCVTGGQWLASRCAMAGSTARERLRIAAKLRSMPIVFATLADGIITYAKARALAAVYRPATAEAFARDETMLVGIARNLSVDDLTVALRDWAVRADPDGTDQRIERTERDRRAHLSPTLDGTARLDANLTAEATAIIGPALAGIADDLRRAETDAAASTLTATQRRHDALVEMARRATAAPPGSSPAAPLFVLNLDSRALTEGRAGVDPVTGLAYRGETLRRLACDAGIVRVITNGRSQPLDIGQQTRNPNPAQRRAVLLRDGGCQFPGCDRPPDWCQPHHIIHWAGGGPTDLANLVLLCSHHHHLVHEGGYRCSGIAPDHITWARPDGFPIVTTFARAA